MRRARRYARENGLEFDFDPRRVRRSHGTLFVVHRQFATADINTIISVIREANSVADGEPTRFVTLRAEFDDALADSANRR